MAAAIRHDWQHDELQALFDLPFPELLFRAAAVHREHFDPAQVQVSTLLSVKTGGCLKTARTARRHSATPPGWTRRS